MALNADMQGVIAENKQREVEGISLAYSEEDFNHIADQMRDEMAYSTEKDCTTGGFVNSPLHDRIAVLAMMDELTPEQMVASIDFMQKQLLLIDK